MARAAPVVDAAGDVISYTLAVTNTGNAAIANVVVTDPNAERARSCAAPTGW